MRLSGENKVEAVRPRSRPNVRDFRSILEQCLNQENSIKACESVVTGHSDGLFTHNPSTAVSRLVGVRCPKARFLSH